MKMWKKVILPTTLAAILIIPSAIYAADDDASTTTEAVNPTTKVKQFFDKRVGIKHHREHAAGFGVGTHRQTYLELLAEKYAPDTLDEWEAAFAERDALMEEFKSLNVKGELQDKKEAIQSELQSKMAELKEKVQNGEMDREELKAQLDQWKEEHKDVLQTKRDQLKENWQPVVEQRKAIFDSFTNAIESEDEAAIKAALAEMLKVLQTENQQLKEKLETLKEKLAETEENSVQ